MEPAMEKPVQHHRPLHCFLDGVQQPGPALLLLNCHNDLRGLEKPITEHWTSFPVHVCADGGSNSLYDALSDEERERCVPEYIVGDLDSARPEVLDYYKNKGTQVVEFSDQDTTDFQKALNFLTKSHSTSKFSDVYVFNTLWGRMDQVLANLNTLYSVWPGVNVRLLTEDSMMFVLQPGGHVIHTDTGLEEGHCGLVPLGQACQTCSTTGLTWNLEGHTLQIGGLISTNNLLQRGAGQVTVDCSHQLLWTMSHKLCHKRSVI